MANALNQDELEFVKAIEDFKRTNHKLFLSWTDVLGIVRDLGYRKSELQKRAKCRDKATQQ